MLETFLIFGIAFIAIGLWIIFNPKVYLFFTEKSEKIGKQIKETQIQSLDELSKDDKFYLKEGLKLGITQLLYSIWGIIGLFTSLNIFFIPLVLLSGLNPIIRKRIKSGDGKVVFIIVDNVLSVSIIIAILTFYFGPMLIG